MVLPTVVPQDKGKGKAIQQQGKAIQQEAGDVEKNRTRARIKKPTLAARSPFNERAVRLTAKANIVDRELYYWLPLRDDVVYKDSFKETLHGEFQSLAPFKRVSPAIVDTWSSYLNNMEQLKAPVSRLFFSTNPCKETIVDAPTEWNAKQKLDTFWTRLFGEALGMSILQWETFDMIFFPIWGAAQEYVICFDLPDGKMNIIDHSFPEPDASVEAKYGKTPFLLKKFFSEALTRCKVPKMAAQVRKCRTHVSPCRGETTTSLTREGSMSCVTWKLILEKVRKTGNVVSVRVELKASRCSASNMQGPS
ncbi:uncharacterized protein LOC121775554 [Salvia splendens]|uniref:uncharacterized protein LOC121775554 n=1 Tax=Salvia splendens TaxID=180675 RepID=UPI001C26E931|nr:uncharacterized protein LOC121775554 [Salvia splendens]